MALRLLLACRLVSVLSGSERPIMCALHDLREGNGRSDGDAGEPGRSAAPTIASTRRALARWLAANVEGCEGPIEVRQFHGGASNPTFMVLAGDQRLVLRKKPPGQLLQSAHQVDREYRVMKALGTTGFPVPQHARALPRRERDRHHLLRDGLHGRPHLPRRAAAGPGARRAHRDLRRAQRRRSPACTRSTTQAIGLGDYGRPGNYFARQIDRWTKQYRGAETEPHRGDGDR